MEVDLSFDFKRDQGLVPDNLRRAHVPTSPICGPLVDCAGSGRARKRLKHDRSIDIPGCLWCITP